MILARVALVARYIPARHEDGPNDRSSLLVNNRPSREISVVDGRLNWGLTEVRHALSTALSSHDFNRSK
jgi:hypothetical protein